MDEVRAQSAHVKAPVVHAVSVITRSLWVRFHMTLILLLVLLAGIGSSLGAIRVQPLFGPTSWFQGIDAGADGEPELSLDETDPLLPAE